jgi:uncharacterized protein
MYNPPMPSLAATLVFIVLLQSPSSASQPAPDVITQARAVLASIAAKEFSKVEEQFTSDMKAALPAGRLAAMWTALQFKAGTFRSCGTNPRVRKMNNKQMVITACDFERSKIDVQFAFDAAGRISGLAFRPLPAAAVAYPLPSYAAPSSYGELETTVGSGEWALPATLTVPSGSGPVPAIILVHGSGPNDRDETIGANKPFRDLATGLASRGIAVLRYDKRSKVHGARMAALTDFTVEQAVIEDVRAAVKVLYAQPRIDPARIFVLGHSLGGMLIPRIATNDPGIAGLIVMAGPARPLERAIAEQARYLAAADGAITSEEQQTVDQVVALEEDVRSLKPADAKSGRMLGGLPASYWLDLRGYDAPSAAKSVRAPMLILQGERDYQVTLEEFAKWKDALGSRRDVRFHSYPRLNHLFIAGTGPSLPAEYQVAGHVAEEVIRDIASWILVSRP